jgi:hypothetical protein
MTTTNASHLFHSFHAGFHRAVIPECLNPESRKTTASWPFFTAFPANDMPG